MLHLRHSPILTPPTIHQPFTHFFVVSLYITLFFSVSTTLCQFNKKYLMDIMLVEINQNKTQVVSGDPADPGVFSVSGFPVVPVVCRILQKAFSSTKGETGDPAMTRGLNGGVAYTANLTCLHAAIGSSQWHSLQHNSESSK